MYDINGNSLAAASNTVFQGKTAIFFGDSITEVNAHYTKGYHAWVKDILGLTSYTNQGVSGADYSYMLGRVNAASGNYDIAFIMGGINERNTPLGEFGDTDNTTIYGRLDLLCSAFKNKYATKIAVFITPPYQSAFPHTDGVTAYDFRIAIFKTCAKYSIAVYDNCMMSGIGTGSLSYYTVDGCHWNDIAHEKVGKDLAQWMLGNFAYITTPVS